MLQKVVRKLYEVGAALDNLCWHGSLGGPAEGCQLHIGQVQSDATCTSVGSTTEAFGRSSSARSNVSRSTVKVSNLLAQLKASQALLADALQHEREDNDLQIKVMEAAYNAARQKMSDLEDTVRRQHLQDTQLRTAHEQLLADHHKLQDRYDLLYSSHETLCCEITKLREEMSELYLKLHGLQSADERTSTSQQQVTGPQHGMASDINISPSISSEFLIDESEMNIGQDIPSSREAPQPQTPSTLHTTASTASGIDAHASIAGKNASASQTDQVSDRQTDTSATKGVGHVGDVHFNKQHSKVSSSLKTDHVNYEAPTGTKSVPRHVPANTQSGVDADVNNHQDEDVRDDVRDADGEASCRVINRDGSLHELHRSRSDDFEVVPALDM